jgi:cytoskeletal protein CcmA (bactofilin family)
VVVYGHVKGNVRATRQIKKEGSVIGNLTTAHILIEDGANFRGTIGVFRYFLSQESQFQHFRTTNEMEWTTIFAGTTSL